MPLFRSLRVLTALADLALLASPALANWPGDPNSNVAICTAPVDQGDIVSVSDGAGGAIIAWDDQRTGSGLYDIYVQRVDAFGHVLWTPNGVGVCVRDSLQALPFIASDGAGGAIITWTDQRNGDYDIFAQRVNASGVPQWTTNGVAIVTGVGDQVASSIVSDGAGGAIIAWPDPRSGNSDIYARRINAAGVPQWTANGVLLCSALGDQYGPLMVSDGAGGAVIAWLDERAGTTNPDIYVRAINAAGAPQWTADGVALCTATGVQTLHRIVSDGAGGAIVAWDDARLGSGNHDIYARRVNSVGAAQWTANGVGVCTLASEQYTPDIAPDGSGGAFIVWRDDRSSTAVYAQRLNSVGAAQWTANGLPVCTVLQNLAGPNPRVISDGAGGAFVTWNDYRVSASSDVYTQRLNSAGSPLWPVNGLAISTATDSQQDASLVSDGAGGIVLAWQDWRTGFADVYAARAEASGILGTPEPIIHAVGDVPNDQGGKVQLLWESSSLDAGPSNPIESYNVWRRVVTTSAAQPRIDSEHLRVDPNGAASTFWEFIVTVPARGVPGYAYTVTTGSDSMAASTAWNVFFVEAKRGVTYYTSRVDSGYSVDNLSPAAPTPFSGNVVGATTHLHWDPNGESDLFGYRLYRGGSSGFVPGPGNLIAAQSDTGYTDATVGSYYKLSAVDVHGNESPYALLAPQQTTDAGPRPAVTALMLAGANPVRGRVALRYTLAEAGMMRLAVFDAAGRVMKILAAEIREPGEYAVRWDGRSDAGRLLASGVYLARLETPRLSREVRFVLLR